VRGSADHRQGDEGPPDGQLPVQQTRAPLVRR